MKKIIFIISAILIFGVIYAADCNVDWGTTHQPIKGFGASNAWAGSTMPDNLETFFFNTTGSNLGISIIRMRLPDSNGGEVPSIKKALIINPLITVWGAPWTPQNTAWKSTGSLNAGCLISTYYQAYADYLTKYVKDLATNNGINLYACSIQNEPDWDTSGNYEMCTWTAEQMHQFVKTNFGPAMQASNPTCKILMPESFHCTLALSDTTLNDAAAAPYVGIVGEHFYGLSAEPNNPPAYPLAVSQGKEYWETEYYNNYLGTDAYDPTMTEGLNTAREIHNAMTAAEFNAYHYWWFQSGGTNTNSGLLPQGCADPSCAPKYAFCFGQFSKFIRPGYIRIDTSLNPTAGVYVSAYKNPATGDFAIVAINTNGAGTSQRFVLIGGMNPTTVTPWLTDSGNNLIQQGAAAVAGGAFTYMLPASSVMTFYGNSGTVPTTPTFTPTVTPIPCGIMLDDCEDGNNTNNWGGSWYNYVSNTSTILPSPFVMTAPGMAGSANYCASMTGNIATGAYGGMGCNLNSGGTGVTLTGYTGVEFYAKGTGSYWFQLTQTTITGSYFGYAVNVASTTTWTKFTVNFPADLTQRYGGPGTLNLNDIIALQWANNANGAMDLQVDNIRFLQACGTATNTPAVTATRTPSRTMTGTPTFTQAITSTYTRTPSPTFTRTASATGSPTFSRTSTPSATNTFSGTPTFTATIGSSSTSTATRTYTASSTGTGTATRTATATITFTPTFTRSATPTNTVVNSPTFTGTATATFTNTPVNTRTFTPTRTATGTSTPTPTGTRTITPSATYTGTASPTPTYTATPSATFTRTPSATASITNTFTITATYTNSPAASSTTTPTQTRTFTASATFTATPTASATPTNTGTRTPTATPSASATASPSASFTRTQTATATGTSTFTITPTHTNSPIASGTITPSQTRTFTVTQTYTATPSASASASPSVTNTQTRTGTPTNTGTQTATFTRTATVTPTGTNSVPATATYTSTAGNTATRTLSASNTATSTPTASPSLTATAFASFTMTITVTNTRSFTPSGTPTSTGSVSATASASPSNTYTKTPTATPSRTTTTTNTETPDVSPTETVTGTPPTSTITATGTATATVTCVGDGSAVISPAVQIVPGSCGNTVSLIYTNGPAAWPSSPGYGTLKVRVPAGWSAPSLAGISDPGNITAFVTGGNFAGVSVSGMDITVHISDLASNTGTVTVVYGLSLSGACVPAGTVDTCFTVESTSSGNITCPIMNQPACLNAVTPTPTFTVSPTATITAFITSTNTPTSSSSATPQNSYTRTPTVTVTVVLTPTNTPQGSATNTAVSTVSITASRTPSFTATASTTSTFTWTITRTLTLTLTITSTPSGTPTASRTATATPSSTQTALPATATVTRTSTAAPTPTATAGEAATPAITDFAPYPNPYVPSNPGGINFYFTTARTLVSYTIDIYTDAFRLVKREQSGSVSLLGSCHVNIPGYSVSKFASGSYYCVIKGKDSMNREAKSASTVLVILR